jgi:hypothetical protein
VIFLQGCRDTVACRTRRIRTLGVITPIAPTSADGYPVHRLERGELLITSSWGLPLLRRRTIRVHRRGGRMSKKIAKAMARSWFEAGYATGCAEARNRDDAYRSSPKPDRRPASRARAASRGLGSTADTLARGVAALRPSRAHSAVWSGWDNRMSGGSSERRSWAARQPGRSPASRSVTAHGPGWFVGRIRSRPGSGGACGRAGRPIRRLLVQMTWRSRPPATATAS